MPCGHDDNVKNCDESSCNAQHMDFSSGDHWVPVWVAERNACEKCGWEDGFASCDKEGCEALSDDGTVWFTQEMGVTEERCLRCNPFKSNAREMHEGGEWRLQQPRHDLFRTANTILRTAAK